VLALGGIALSLGGGEGGPRPSRRRGRAACEESDGRLAQGASAAPQPRQPPAARRGERGAPGRARCSGAYSRRET
jgi:hypothetical protein